MPRETRQIDSTIDVVTPENIAFQYQLAGPFRRLPALLCDLAIRIAILITIVILAGLSGIFGAGEFVFALMLLLWFVLEWFYGGLLETFWNGQTLGKRMLGMRVMRIDGQPINGLQAVLRNILRSVDLMPLIPLGAWIGEEGPWIVPTCLIGLLTPVLNRRYQRLGDLVCGTMVVVEERHWLMTVAKLDEPAIPALAAELPASFQVSHKLSQALAAYVERRRYLSVPRRAEIARHLAEHLTERLKLPADTDPDLLLCALYYRTFVLVQRSAGAVASRRPAAVTPDPAVPIAPAPVAPIAPSETRV